MRTSHEKLGLALGFAGVVLFGGTLPATRLTVAWIDPLFLTAGRATIAGCSALALLVLLRRPLPPRELWRDIAVAGLCTIIGFPVLMALAMVTVPAAHGGVVLGIVPLVTVAAATIVNNERPSMGFWIASVTGACIVLAFVLRQSEARTIGAGTLFLLGTVIASGFGYALSGRLSRRMPGWEAISWQVLLYLPLSAAASLLLWPNSFANVPVQAWAGFAYVSFVSMFLAFFVFNAAMAIGGIARVGQLMLLQPFVIVGLASVINNERLELATLGYAAAVVATVIIGQRMRVTRG